jgi:hypothetical protein
MLVKPTKAQVYQYALFCSAVLSVLMLAIIGPFMLFISFFWIYFLIPLFLYYFSAKQYFKTQSITEITFKSLSKLQIIFSVFTLSYFLFAGTLLNLLSGRSGKEIFSVFIVIFVIILFLKLLVKYANQYNTRKPQNLVFKTANFAFWYLLTFFLITGFLSMSGAYYL